MGYILIRANCIQWIECKCTHSE